MRYIIPNTGYIEEETAKKLGDVLNLSVIRYSLLGLLWFIICLKWLIKAWGHIPIFFVILGFSKCSPNMDPRTPYLLPKYVLTIQEKTTSV